MVSDMGKGSLAVLLVLALLVSVITTFLVLDAAVAPMQNEPQVRVMQQSSGSVELSIAQPRETVTQQAQVTLTIKR
jgi:hypothetical protein